ncbi:MAG TPA: ATP-binding protein [Pirellulales bacterium]|nr:ATP-binding protein [Pirellulales bacterium]
MPTDHLESLTSQNAELRRRLQEAEEKLLAQSDLRDSLSTALFADELLPPMALLAADGNLVRCSERFSELLQRPGAELLGHSLLEFVAPLNQPLCETLLQAAPTEGALALMRSDGRAISLILGVRPVPSETGSDDLLLVDLTDQKRQVQLAAAESLARSILEQTVEAIVVCDRMGVILRASRAARELAGENPLRRDFSAAFPLRQSRAPLGAEKGAPLFQLRPILQGETIRHQAVSLSIGARRVELLLNAGPLLNERQEAMGAVVALTDVTEQRQIEQSLSASETRERVRAAELDTVLNAVPAAVWIATDPRCQEITGNLAAYELTRTPLGRNISATSPAPLERTFSEFREGRPVPPHELPMQVAARDGVEIRDAELTLRFFDGEERHIFGNAVPLRDLDGSLRGVISAFADVTELKRAQQALQAADQRKDEFLAMLAHELRNPLAPIRNAVELLRLLGPRTAELMKAEDMIDRQIEHMVRMIDDLLDVARIARGKILLRKSRCDLAAIVREAAEDYDSILSVGGISLETEIAAGAVPVQGDRTRLAQVIGNLLTNAAKFTDRGGHVALRLASRPAEHRAVITVRDSGIGMERDMLDRLFQPFSQANRSLDRSRGGLGLGLALAKGLIELHGGGIAATSLGSGQGSEFTIWLPLDTIAPPATADREPAAPRAALRILLIEDSADLAETMARLLEIAGHVVAVAVNGPSGLRQAAEFKPEVVLCDIGLPGALDGYQVARALRAAPETASAYLIALSGYGQDDDRRRSLEAGFDLHLVKPVRMQELRQILGELTPAR